MAEEKLDPTTESMSKINGHILGLHILVDVVLRGLIRTGEDRQFFLQSINAAVTDMEKMPIFQLPGYGEAIHEGMDVAVKQAISTIESISISEPDPRRKHTDVYAQLEAAGALPLFSEYGRR